MTLEKMLIRWLLLYPKSRKEIEFKAVNKYSIE